MAGHEDKSAKNPASDDSRESVHDVCGLYERLEILPYSRPENGEKREKYLLGEGDICSIPLHIAYDNWNARMKSFDSWPSSLKPRPDKLSAAGFFYTGSGDKTTCFNCGLTLWNWNPTDDPWIEHCRWAFRCTYIVLTRESVFFKKVAKMPPILYPEATVHGFE